MIGSALAATSGNVGGFRDLPLQPQRPGGRRALENRNAMRLHPQLDNTAGTATGIAINAVSSQAINIPVIVRDDTRNPNRHRHLELGRQRPSRLHTRRRQISRRSGHPRHHRIRRPRRRSDRSAGNPHSQHYRYVWSAAELQAKTRMTVRSAPMYSALGGVSDSWP